MRDRTDGWCRGVSGGLEAGCGAVISAVQMRTCLCLRDAALSQARQYTCGERDYVHTTLRLSLWLIWDLHLVVLFVRDFSGM